MENISDTLNVNSRIKINLKTAFMTFFGFNNLNKIIIGAFQKLTCFAVKAEAKY